MSTLVLELRDDLAKLVEEAALSRQTTPSAVVSACIEAHLGLGELHGGMSLHDLTKDLIENYGGPPDLATNPSYMAGFGE